MNLMPVPFAFIQTRTSLSWREALWGYEHQMIAWRDIVGLATSLLQPHSGARELELSTMGKSEAHLVGELLRELAAAENEILESTIVRKWLFLVLAWTYENSNRVDDPLSEVDVIYADFGYPAEIESFVRYMPPQGGYDPSQHSAQENRDRLFDYWRKYLQSAGQEFGVAS